MENLDLAYSLFNQYLYQDVKNNISHIEYYFQTNPNTMTNPLISEFVYAIKNYPLEAIDVPLFQSIFTKQGKSRAESDKIMAEIIKWKQYNKEQVAPAKKLIQDICAGSLISRANKLHANSPADFIKYLKSTNFKTSDVDVLRNVEFGEIDINSIIADSANDGVPSHYDWINKTFEPDCKIERGQMILMSASPGCFVGSTEVYVRHEKKPVMTLKELYEEGKKCIYVTSKTKDRCELSIARGGCVLTKYTKELVEITTSDGGVLKCTPDHKFLLNVPNAVKEVWRSAEDLKIGSHLSQYKDPINPWSRAQFLGPIKVVDKKKITLEEEVPVYDIVDVDLYNNFAIRTSEGRGVIVHNCGKSLYAMSEALSMAVKGHKVHYLALGDLNMKDFIVRMGAMHSGLSFGDTKRNLGYIYNKMSNEIGDKLGITICPAGFVDVDEYIEFIKDSDYEVLFIDYDSNFKGISGDNMYSEYGDVYAKLTALTALGKIVFILAQPKVSSWGNEVIEQHEVGESSRKQHTVDIIITRGRVVGSPNNLGCFKIVKNRRGEVGVVDYSIRLNNGRFMSLPRELYEQLKLEKERMNWTESDIVAKVNQFNMISGQRGMSGIAQPKPQANSVPKFGRDDSPF